MKKIVLSLFLLFTFITNIIYAQKGKGGPGLGAGGGVRVIIPVGTNNVDVLVGNGFATATNNYDPEIIGQFHNEFLDYFKEKLLQLPRPICLKSDLFMPFFNQCISDFLLTKGVVIDKSTLPSSFRTWYDIIENDDCNSSFDGPEYQRIICELTESGKKLFAHEITSNDYITKCDELYDQIPTTDDVKTKALQTIVKISRSSTVYWSDANIEAWAEIYKTMACDPSIFYDIKKADAELLKSLGIADLKGAVAGARMGLAGGVAGAVAGGLLGGATYSACQGVWEGIKRWWHQ